MGIKWDLLLVDFGVPGIEKEAFSALLNGCAICILEKPQKNKPSLDCHSPPSALPVFLLPFYSKTLKESPVLLSPLPPCPFCGEPTVRLSLCVEAGLVSVTGDLRCAFLMPSHLTYLSAVFETVNDSARSAFPPIFLPGYDILLDFFQAHR